MSRTDTVVDQMLRDEDWLRRFLRAMTQTAAYLIAKREWDRDVSFETTEKLKNLMEEQISEEDIVEIYSEGDYDLDLDLDLEDIEEHLQQYHPDNDTDTDDKDT